MLAKEGEESVNSLLTKKLADFVRTLDPTRPITAGCNEPNPANHLFRSGALDIIGYNYHNVNIPEVPKNFPGKPFIITESNSALMTRGYYRMPSDQMFISLNAGINHFMIQHLHVLLMKTVMFPGEILMKKVCC